MFHKNSTSIPTRLFPGIPAGPFPSRLIQRGKNALFHTFLEGRESWIPPEAAKLSISDPLVAVSTLAYHLRDTDRRLWPVHFGSEPAIILALPHRQIVRYVVNL